MTRPPAARPSRRPAAAYVFSPGLWWIGSGMGRSGPEVQILRMCSWGEAAGGLGPAGEGAGGHDVREIRAQLLVAAGVEARDGQRESDLPDRCPARFTVLDRAVRPPDVTACRDNSPLGCCLILQTPGRVGPCQTVLDPARPLSSHQGRTRSRPRRSCRSAWARSRACSGSRAALRPECRSPSGANRWRNDRARSRAWAAGTPVPPSCRPCRPGGHGRLACAVNADEQAGLAFDGRKRGDVDVNRRSAQRQKPMG